MDMKCLSHPEADMELIEVSETTMDYREEFRGFTHRHLSSGDYTSAISQGVAEEKRTLTYACPYGCQFSTQVAEKVDVGQRQATKLN